jgi:hypothetical protein
MREFIAGKVYVTAHGNVRLAVFEPLLLAGFIVLNSLAESTETCETVDVESAGERRRRVRRPL